MSVGSVGPEVRAADVKPNAKVAVAVDPDKFFNLLMPRLTAAS